MSSLLSSDSTTFTKMNMPQQMSQQESQPCIFRSVIALNNMGVLLLEQQAFYQAIDTFKDAILALRLMLLPVSLLERSSSLPVTTVNAASKRLATPVRFPSNNLIVQAINHDDTVLYPIWNDAIQASCSSENTLFAMPIRFGVVEATSQSRCSCPLRCSQRTDAAQGEIDLTLESSILLYNLGVAYLCLSRLDQEITKIAYSPLQFCEEALQLFELSYAAISKKMSGGSVKGVQLGGVSIPDPSSFDDSLFLERRISVAAAILFATVQGQVNMGWYPCAHQSLGHLQDLVAILEEIETLYCGSPAAASAA